MFNIANSNPFELFCVGDDWQSIYRFAGSDIDFILNFSKYWGSTETSKIETTYRFSQSLIDVSGRFIMQNPQQVRKAIKGKPSDGRFALGEVRGYTEKLSIRFMLERLDDLPQNSTVFFIGRYTFDAQILEDNDRLYCHYNNATGVVDVTYQNRLDLKMSFITAHKSKGLQAEYVFIINNRDGKMGFPSQIEDAPIFELLLGGNNTYPFDEERRLYYVALTRARKKVYVVTIDNHESVFIAELKERHGEDIKRERWECPVCGARLVKREGPYGEFYGCANYRDTGCRYTRKIKTSREV